MNNFKLFCITNIQNQELEDLPFDLAGVGKNTFNSNYITCNKGQNINEKEKYYSELTFHYWFWKNKLNHFPDVTWIGFCQRRRFWVNSTNIEENYTLKNIILNKPPIEWNGYNSVITKPIDLKTTKTMKIIKRGWKNLLKNPNILFNKNLHTIKLHFDMHHGHGVLDKAIHVMQEKDREDFRSYVSTKTFFSPHIMFFSKKKIIDQWFNDLFNWLFECEKIFGFDKLKGYDQTRLYAYLAERYLSFWFKKYTKTIEWPWIFKDIN